MSTIKPVAGVLSDANILKIYHDLYWNGEIGSTTHSERIVIGRAIERAVTARLAEAGFTDGQEVRTQLNRDELSYSHVPAKPAFSVQATYKFIGKLKPRRKQMED